MSSKDLVERLRSLGSTGNPELAHKAADRIEALERVLDFGEDSGAINIVARELRQAEWDTTRQENFYQSNARRVVEVLERYLELRLDPPPAPSNEEHRLQVDGVRER